MKITEVQVMPIKPRDGIVAFASCVINNELYLGSIAIATSPSSETYFRAVFPTKKLPNGKNISCAHPITREAGTEIQEAILTKFFEVAQSSQEEQSPQ